MRPAALGRLVAVAVMTWPFLALAQQVPPAGVVTTLTGQATVTRAAAPSLPLRFKDDVFMRDRIATRESSLVRVLLGGKALVTVRELSTLTITEEAGRSTVGIDSGKIAVGVAPRLMRPGESIEIRTPNAVATVRGTVLIVEVMRASAQAGGPPPAAVSTVSVLSGSVDFSLSSAPGTVVKIGPMQSLSATGGTLGQVRPIPPGALAQLLKGLKGGVQKTSAPASTAESVSNTAESNALALASALTGAPIAQSGRALFAAVNQVRGTGLTTAPVVPTTRHENVAEEVRTATLAITPAIPTSPTVTNTVLVNGGFETGNFSSWTTEGAAAVIQNFGAIRPPEGNYFALIHTGPGSVDLAAANGGVCPNSTCTRSTIKQPFKAVSAANVKFRATLMSNEFPEFTGSSSSFNDQFVVNLVDSAGQTRAVYSTTVNQQNSNFAHNPSPITVGTFTLSTDAGIVDLGEISTTVVPASGTATLSFNIFNVNDTAYDSGALIDAVTVTQDPPLHALTDGSAFTWDSTVHLLNGGSETFDSLLLVCCGSTATLHAGLLDAVDSSITMPFSVLTLTQGGTLVSLSPDPLVRLRGGSYALGTSVAVFDVSGVNVAFDPESGLVLGTEQPLRHGGTFLEAWGATIDTRTVLRIDNALLEASRPLLDLNAGSVLAASGPVVDMSLKSRVTSLGPMIRLDASTLVAAGPLFRINGGSLTGSGPLLALANGSRITAASLASVQNGLFSWAGPLAQFTGTGNSITFTNNLCASASCVTIGGVRFALRNGASASNIAVTNRTPWAGPGGTVNLPGSAAVFDVQGATSRVNIR